MLKSKIQSLINKKEKEPGFEVITDKSASDIMGGDCAKLKICQTYDGPCSTLDDRGGCGVYTPLD